MLIEARFIIRDAEVDVRKFNDWYSTVHVPDFLDAPGVLSGRRFFRQLEKGIYEFVALYEHDGSCLVSDTFASSAGRRSVEDFRRYWADLVGEPSLSVFHEVGVASSYHGWPIEIEKPAPEDDAGD